MIDEMKLILKIATKTVAVAMSFLWLLVADSLGVDFVHAADEPQSIEGRAQGESAFVRRLSMGSGKSAIIDLPKDVSEIVIGNPKVVDAVVRTPRKIYVIGAEAGQSTIIGLDAQGHEVARLEISIGRDVGQLNALLRAALPNAHITAQTVNDAIILTGSANSAGEAQRAIDIAKGFITRMGVGGASGGCTPESCIINAMTLRGEDQVMLRVTVAEVDRKVIKQLGVSAQSNGDTLLNGGWGKFIVENPYVVNAPMSATTLTFNGLNNTSLTIKAFEKYGVSRILAEPTVTAVSGENAKFVVGGEIAVPASGTCTFGVTGGQTFCTPGITFKPYGVSLSFTPVVLSEGRISLHLSTEVTEVDLASTFTYNGVSVPGFKTRKNETTVELASGASIATAGLIGQASAAGVSGVPGLLNLPILGALFRSRDYQRRESELLIVVTPFIARAVSSHEVVRPDDGFVDASDPQGWLLGRVNRIYSTRSNPQMRENFKGQVGFIHD
jgi:pilus assembly protein CpaC